MTTRLRLLWNQQRVVGRAAVAGLLFGTLLAFLLPARFESTTRLMPPDNQSNSGLAMIAALMGKTGNGIANLGADLLGLKTSGALFIGILRSRTVEDRLVERFHLQKVYWWIRSDDEVRQKLEENTGISEDRKSGIITITVTDGDPQRAAAIAQAYVEQLDRLVAELSTSAAHRERVFLDERLKVVKLDLDQASRDFSQFASKNVAIDMKEQGKAMVEAAAVLQGQLIAAESELKGLQEIYTPQNVRVRSAQARVEELKRQLRNLGGKADLQPEDAANSDDTLYPSIRKLPLLGVTFADLYRRTRIQEVVFETLTQQDELAKVQEAKETPSVKVLDVARVPERKSFPPRLLLMFLCTVLGVAGSFIWILGRARWEEIDPADPGKVFAGEVFQAMNSSMPWAPPNGSRLQVATHRVWTKLVRRNGSAEEAK
jgi:capsule polysaccharide export protein KpsE/RkpR